MTAAQEITFNLGTHVIAAKRWQHPNGIPTLAVHGWLDNAASFDYLAPLLTDCDIVAIDLTGHGLSSHKPDGVTLSLLDFITDFLPVLEQLQWEQFIFLGHSLGAALGSILAGTLPDRVKALIALDALGPMSALPEHAPDQFALFLKEWAQFGNKRTRHYASRNEAVQSRLRVNKMHEHSCRALIERGLLQHPDGSWSWASDPRLRLPSPIQLSEDQVLAFLSRIVCPTLVIRPTPGFPFPEQVIQHRTQCIADLTLERPLGHHHVHLDTPQPIAQCIQSFLDKKLVL